MPKYSCKKNLLRACALTFALAATAHAQTFPAKPLRIVVPFAPGGSSDIQARLIGQKLTEAWGQPVIIDNRGGAGGIVASEIAAHAPATGPGGRALMVYEAVDGADLQRQLAPRQRKLSTASVALDADRFQLLDVLDRLGVHRHCAPGAMQAPRADRAPDGHVPFAALVRLTDRQ